MMTILERIAIFIFYASYLFLTVTFIVNIIEVAVSGNYFIVILLTVPIGLMWFFYCHNLTLNERYALRSNEVDVFVWMEPVSFGTHAWYRMTLRNPWKLYKASKDPF